MIRPLLLLVILLLLVSSLSCASAGPSDSDVKNAVWDYLEKQRGFEFISGNMRGIEVDQIGKPWTYSEGINEIDVWPVRGHIVWRGPRIELYEYDIFENAFGEWVVWPFTVP